MDTPQENREKSDKPIIPQNPHLLSDFYTNMKKELQFSIEKGVQSLQSKFMTPPGKNKKSH